MNKRTSLLTKWSEGPDDDDEEDVTTLYFCMVLNAGLSLVVKYLYFSQCGIITFTYKKESEHFLHHCSQIIG